MKMTVESTTRIVHVNGVPARIWQGTTEDGVAVVVAVTRLAVAKAADAHEFERDLVEHAPPGVDAVQAFPLRMVL